MKISAVNNISYQGKHKKLEAAAVATLLTVTPVGYAMSNDTFEKEEAPTEMCISSSAPISTSQTTVSKTEGNKFCKWFWDMIDCIGDDDKFNTNHMKEKGYNYYYPEVTDYKGLAQSLVTSMDKNGDNEVDLKEFSDKGIEVLQKQGMDYSYKQELNMRENVLAPLFKGLDYIGSGKDRTNGTNTLSVKELAGNLSALSKKNLKTGRLTGSNVAAEFINIMYEGHPTGQFVANRDSYR